MRNTSQFLLYSPLNQGLKPTCSKNSCKKFLVFTLQSIKSRIETKRMYKMTEKIEIVFTLQSIKSRIETERAHKRTLSRNYVFTLQSIKSRIETNTDSNLSPEEQPGFYSTVH